MTYLFWAGVLSAGVVLEAAVAFYYRNHASADRWTPVIRIQLLLQLVFIALLLILQVTQPD